MVCTTKKYLKFLLQLFLQFVAKYKSKHNLLSYKPYVFIQYTRQTCPVRLNGLTAMYYWHNYILS
uniref:Uncharacterized protein n=1 Tax=Anguilla anguilla TaxID=7936 RepID=A0A0E9QL27_ANGAN